MLWLFFLSLALPVTVPLGQNRTQIAVKFSGEVRLVDHEHAYKVALNDIYAAVVAACYHRGGCLEVLEMGRRKGERRERQVEEQREQRSGARNQSQKENEKERKGGRDQERRSYRRRRQRGHTFWLSGSRKVISPIKAPVCNLTKCLRSPSGLSTTTSQHPDATWYIL